MTNQEKVRLEELLNKPGILTTDEKDEFAGLLDKMKREAQE